MVRRKKEQSMKAATSPTSRYGWHWRHANGGLSYQDLRTPAIGERLRAKTRRGRPVTRAHCAPGFHASPRIHQQHGRGFGNLVSFVLVEGLAPQRRSMTKDHKFVGTHRTILWETEVPAHLKGEKELLAFVASKGFRRASARRKAAAVLKKARK